MPSSSQQTNQRARIAVLTLLVGTITLSRGHGFLTYPVARQKGASDLSTAGTVCAYCSCCWFDNGVKIPGKPTICDPAMLTGGAMNSKTLCTGHDWTASKPWRAPGTAPIKSPCGSKSGEDGRTLPAGKREIWQQGSTAEIGMAITANHGGGSTISPSPSPSAEPVSEMIY